MNANVTNADLVLHVIGPDLSPAHTPILDALRAESPNRRRHLFIQIGTPPVAAGLRADVRVAPTRLGGWVFKRRLLHALRRISRDLTPSQTLMHIWTPTALRCVFGFWSSLARGAVVEADDPAVVAGPAGWSMARQTLLWNAPTAVAHKCLRAAGVPRHSIIGVSAVVRETLESADRDAARRRLGIPDGAPVLGLLPPTRRETGGMMAVWATLLLAQIRPDTRLLVLGEGAEVAKMRRLTVACHHPQVMVEAAVHCTIAELVATADIAVFLPSRRPPSAGLLWALAARRPIVAADTPHMRAMLQHEQSAVLCRTDAPKATTAALLRLIEDQETACALGQASRKSHKLIARDGEGVDGYEGVYARLSAGEAVIGTEPALA